MDGLFGGGWVSGITAAGTVYAGTQNLLGVVVTSTCISVQATVKTVSATAKIISIAGKAANVISNFIPVVSGAKDVYQGVKSGNWWQVGLGAASIALDLFTLGADELVAGTIRTAVKESAEQIAREEAEQVIKSETKQLVEKKGLQEVEEGAGKVPCGCFLAGTAVLTDSGYRPIEKIKPGDRVWAYNDTTHTFDRKRVVRVFEHVRDSVYELHIGTEVIYTTSDHPFFVGGRWLRVAALHVGDSVTTYHGNKVAISAIGVVAKHVTVHNFEVADYHTYYVSHEQVLVHNNGPCDNVLPNGKSGKNATSGNSSAAQTGQAKHAELRAKVKAKGNGWNSEPSMEGVNGKMYKPDIETPSGNLIEMKPYTERGISRGATQARTYARQLGRKVRVVYYKP